MSTPRRRSFRTSVARRGAEGPRSRAAAASTPETSASRACGRRPHHRPRTTSCTRTRPSTSSSPCMPASTAASLLEGRGDSGVGKARAMHPDELIALIERSDVRGRGGAGYPLSKKMRAVRASALETGREPLLIANAYDADPGSPIARTLIERNKANVLQGVAIAAHAIGAFEAVIYMHPEAEKARS